MATKSGLDAEQYRKFLVEAVKAAGQMMIDNAEDAVGNTDFISDFSISFYFSQENNGGIPEMTITRSHLPKIEVIDKLLDTRYEFRHTTTDNKEDE